jgi:hypothetical protein
MDGGVFVGEKMSRIFRSAWLRSARFARAHPVPTGLMALAGVSVIAFAMIATYWTQLEELRVPRVLALAIGWFVAVGSTLGIALLLMWMKDQRDVNRARRAIRLNFDHALLAMLDLARQFTAHTERHDINLSIESAQKQIIAASARLKRYENKLTAFPPEALNAYADLENEIDVSLEELNDLHRKMRSERDGRLAKFGFEMIDRVGRFNEFLDIIDARPTQASLAYERLSAVERPSPPADAAAAQDGAMIRRA